jgi:hypothetical protein
MSFGIDSAARKCIVASSPSALSRVLNSLLEPQAEARWAAHRAQHSVAVPRHDVLNSVRCTSQGSNEGCCHAGTCTHGSSIMQPPTVLPGQVLLPPLMLLQPLLLLLLPLLLCRKSFRGCVC